MCCSYIVIASVCICSLSDLPHIHLDVGSTAEILALVLSSSSVKLFVDALLFCDTNFVWHHLLFFAVRGVLIDVRHVVWSLSRFAYGAVSVCALKTVGTVTAEAPLQTAALTAKCL